MNTRTLGKGGSVIGEVGLGCWQFGGDFGAMDEGRAREIMEASLSCGVDFFDTANVYGAGRSEEWIGKFLSGREDSVVVATKYGRGPDVACARSASNASRTAAVPNKDRLAALPVMSSATASHHQWHASSVVAHG